MTNINKAIEEIEELKTTLKELNTENTEDIRVNANYLQLKLDRVKALIESDKTKRYTQKDLCNAYKKGHSDGVLNKPVLDEFEHISKGRK